MKIPMKRLVLLLAAFAVVAAACGGAEEPSATTSTTTTGPRELVLITHDSFAIPDEVLAKFEQEHDAVVKINKAGDAGSMLSQVILTKDNPIADVLFGVDNTFLSRALREDLFIPHESVHLDVVPADLEIDPEHRVTPIDFGDVCLNFDREAFLSAGVPIPDDLRDLTDPTYRGMLVVENPATSSPGLAFLLATIAEFGEEGDYTWKDFWRDLIANDVLVVSGWEEAYYGEFSGGSGEGDRPLVVSYASSPPAEVIFSEEPLTEAPTGVIPEGCFRQIEFAGVLRGTEVEDLAKAFVDFMLSEPFQVEIPLNMFVFPANSTVPLPPEFVEYTVIPKDPHTLPPDVIDENRERWIEEWTEIVLG